MIDSLRRWAAVIALVILGLATSGFGPPTLVESDSIGTAVTSRTIKQMRSHPAPQVSATAAVVIDAASGQVVYQKKAHDRRAMASTTKMMTALVTLENSRLDEVVTASPNVVVEPSIIGLEPGDKLTMEQLLYGLLLPSGNDAALDLAEHVGGSIPGFAAMMNARAAQLGLKNTRFANPHGLDEEGHYSSAYDLALLAREAFRNPVFERIVATKQLEVQGPPRWVFRNNNRLLDSYKGADGVKTGFTDNAGRCLAFSATRDGRRAISIVLNSADMWGDSTALLDHYFAAFTPDSLSPPDIPLKDYDLTAGFQRTVTDSGTAVVFPRWQEPYLQWFITVPDSSSGEGGIAGFITYYLFGKPVAGAQVWDRSN